MSEKVKSNILEIGTSENSYFDYAVVVLIEHFKGIDINRFDL